MKGDVIPLLRISHTYRHNSYNWGSKINRVIQRWSALELKTQNEKVMLVLIGAECGDSLCQKGTRNASGEAPIFCCCAPLW